MKGKDFPDGQNRTEYRISSRPGFGALFVDLTGTISNQSAFLTLLLVDWMRRNLFRWVRLKLFFCWKDLLSRLVDQAETYMGISDCQVDFSRAKRSCIQRDLA